MGAWNAYAIDEFEAGGGVGVVDFGGGSGSTWIAYAAGELPLEISFGDPAIVSSIVARLGTSGTSSQSIVGAVTVDTSLDYFLSGLFKVGYEVTPELTPYAMAGFTFSSMSVKASSPFVAVAGGGTDNSLSWAIGADYHIDDRLKIGVDFSSYLSNVTAFAANVMYKF